MSVAVFVRRVLAALLVMFLVSLLTFFLGRMVPGDPAEILAGDGASAETIAGIRSSLGLDRPILVQYGDWLYGATHGDLGVSLFSGQPVADSISTAAPPTLSVSLLALVIAVAVGVSAGAVAGLNQGRWLDRVISGLSGVGIAIPGFWLAMVLISILTISNPWLPATGYEPLSAGIGPWLSHIIIPALALGLAAAAELARHTRGCVADVLDRPYIVAARARGASGFWLVRKHVLRNAAIPVVTVVGLQFGRLLGGVVVVEAVCGVPGLGTLATSAVLESDYPMIQAYVLLCAVVIVLVNLLTDVAYAVINPKLRAA